ncbi:MAG: M48 family metalloprotease [Hyphomicrobiaceae bacterium]|nr:M48 family metalloprotease [Hyphomicrobiaceae bacterium]
MTLGADSAGRAGKFGPGSVWAVVFRPRMLRGLRRSTAAAMVGVMGLVGSMIGSGPASAQGIPLIRDTEIENLLNDYARPIFKAAGLGTGRVAMRIVRSDVFNAFVVDGRNVFVHTGLLTQANNPNEVIGVIAHEAGHISGGHMAALRARIAKDQTRALLIQILGLAAVIGGAVSGGDTGREVAQGGQGVLFGGNEIVMRSLLAERRSQESAADQAGLSFLLSTGQSGRGMLETFERFAQQEYISDTHKDPFVRSHPVATDRLNQLRRLVQQSPHYNATDSPELQMRHDLMRAKLAGYLDPPSAVFNRYPVSNMTLPARYARAIARYHTGGHGALEAAIAEIDTLIRDKPDNGYFWEVKGDLLMRSGKAALAIPPLRKALSILGNASLVQVQLATALQQAGGPAGMAESIALLRKSLIDDKNPRAYRLLATAYFNDGRRPEADAMIAQAHFLEGDIPKAQIFAKRAQGALKPGTPEWLKNDDILSFKPQT